MTQTLRWSIFSQCRDTWGVQKAVLRWPERNAGAWGRSRCTGQPVAGQDGLMRTLWAHPGCKMGPGLGHTPHWSLKAPLRCCAGHHALSTTTQICIQLSCLKALIFRLSFLLRKVCHSKLMAGTLLLIWTVPGYPLHQSWGDRTHFLEPPLVSNFFNKWFTGKLKPQSSHLTAKSSLKHYNHVQIVGVHPSFYTRYGTSSLWGGTTKVTAGRELAQAYTALLRALLEKGMLQRALIDGIIPSAPRHTSLHRPVTIRSLVTLSPTALLPGK